MILDSNIIIYSVQPGYVNLKTYLLDWVDSLFVSDITRLEVVGYHNLQESHKLYFEEFFRSVTVLPIHDEVIDLAIQLRQQRKRSLGDAVLAATGLIHNQPIVTNNVADFSTVDGLTVISLASILADS